MQARVFGFIHDTHPAPAEFLKDAIVGDGLADDQVEIRHCYRHLRVQTVGKSTNPCGLCFGDKLSTRSWNSTLATIFFDHRACVLVLS